MAVEKWVELQEKVQRAAEQEKNSRASILSLLEKQSAEVSALDDELGENIFKFWIECPRQPVCAPHVPLLPEFCCKAGGEPGTFYYVHDLISRLLESVSTTSTWSMITLAYSTCAIQPVRYHVDMTHCMRIYYILWFFTVFVGNCFSSHCR